MNKNGFTLAEVLITLAVIGVVAALSIPGLIADSQEKEYAVQLKKAYAELSQAIMEIQRTEGFVNAGLASDLDHHRALRIQFGNVMNFTRTGNEYPIFNQANYKFYKGGNSDWPSSSYNYENSAELADGKLMRFISNANCTSWGIWCGEIMVDVNGIKGPNMIGKDYYAFIIVKNNGTYSLKPVGVAEDTYAALPGGCASGSTSWRTSEGCTAKRLLNPDNMP